MNRRHFTKLLGLGVFSILPGAGRIWKATKPARVPFDHFTYLTSAPYFKFVPTIQDFLRMRRQESQIVEDLFTKSVVWLPNMGDTQRRIIIPDQDLKRPT